MDVRAVVYMSCMEEKENPNSKKKKERKVS